MYVVSGSNLREENPVLDMESVFSGTNDLSPKLSPEDNIWKHSFTTDRKIEVLIAEGMEMRGSVVLRIRGYVHDVSGNTSVEKRLRDVFLGSSRIPTIAASVTGRRGNKIIVDITFLVSASDVKTIDESSWTFQLSLPHGYSAVTLCSPLTQTNYLCALVEDPSAVATEISPVSFTLMWPQGYRDPSSVIVNSVPVELPSGSPGRLRISASPETDYVCQIDNGIKMYEVVLRTPAVSRESYWTHYRSCKISDEVYNMYDLSNTDQDTIRDLRRFGVITPGDRILLKGLESLLVAVGSGETISSSGSFYVIPSFDGDDTLQQYLCMETPEGSHVVSFDNTESFVDYNSSRYFHGDRFLLGSRMVEVVKGSLILIFHDDSPLEFPGGVTTASQVATSGDIVIRDLIHKSSSQVTTKVSGDYTYGNSSYYVYDSVNGTTLEATRVTHGVDDSGETGSMSFNVLYTQSPGNQVMHGALEIDPSETKISAIDSTGALEATFDTSGLRFNSDSGDVYFGASQEFRIHYEPASGNDPAMLQIQGYDSSTSSYATRQLITNEPVS